MPFDLRSALARGSSPQRAWYALGACVLGARVSLVPGCPWCPGVLGARVSLVSLVPHAWGISSVLGVSGVSGFLGALVPGCL